AIPMMRVTLQALRMCLVPGVAALALVACERATTLSGAPPAAQGLVTTTGSTTNAPRAQATSAAAPADDYDVSKMDFKPVPAKLSSERHTGAFFAGDA